MRITVHGVRRDIGLGAVATRFPSEARDKAYAIRKAVADGRDPIAERQVRRVTIGPTPVAGAEHSQPTFEACWRAYWLVKEPLLSNGKHRDQWASTMDTYVLPRIGKRAVADIKPSEIIDLLNPIWNSKEETARRVVQRIDAMFVSAITRELATRPALAPALPANSDRSVATSLTTRHCPVPRWLRSCGRCVSAKAHWQAGSHSSS